MSSIFDHLNFEQQRAVQKLDGQLLVLAGAGSGKTRVVTLRIAYLLQQGVLPHQILGLTFTNKAAQEMKDRVMQLTHAQVFIKTFHSLGLRILRESIQVLNYRTDFVIYDPDDVDKLLKMCCEEMGIKATKNEFKGLRSFITNAKNSLSPPPQLPLRGSLESTELELNYGRLYHCYQKKLKEYNALDFDDLLYLPVQIFQEFPDVLDRYQERWRYLLIDEYQDTNLAQYKLVKLLVSKYKNICVVGDPDQSIYSWRGANIHNILSFSEDYPSAEVIRLEQNYRSHTNILQAANAVISHNTQRYEKNLWSDKGPGPKLQWYTSFDEREEAKFIADAIMRHHEQDQIPLNQIVVLYRTNAQSRAFEDCLLSKRIPYTIVGGMSFYQRREIKDILAFLRVVYADTDFLSFSRTLNIPKRGIGEATQEKIRLAAAEARLPIIAFCLEYLSGQNRTLSLSAKQKKGLQDYIDLIIGLRVLVAEGANLRSIVVECIARSGYLDFLKEDPESFEDRKENLDSLIAKAVEWDFIETDPSLGAFLEELALKSTLDETAGDLERVILMTIHNGKGLEFRLAFLAGMEEGLFPHINSGNEEAALEEERRLCYVGMTRAKEWLYLTHCRLRYLWGAEHYQRPSRFLQEIPGEFIQKVSLKKSYY